MTFRLPLVMCLAAACAPDLVNITKIPDDPVEPVDSGLPLDQPQIKVEPTDLSFGKLPPGCESNAQLVTVENIGAGPLEVSSIELSGQRKDGYQLVDAKGLTLDPGQKATFSVRFEAADVVPYNAAKVKVLSNDPDTPQVDVNLKAEGSPVAYYEDVYLQENLDSVDVLWTIDQSGSMSGEVADLANAFADFIQGFVSLGLDYRIAVGTADGSGPCSGLNSGYIDSSTADPVAEFAARTKPQGSCGGEEGFSAAYTALTSAEGQAFLRPDASLAVIAVSDEPEQSSGRFGGGGGPAAFTQWLGSLKGGDMSLVSFNAMVGPDGTNSFIPTGGCPLSAGSDATVAPRYHKAIRQTNGVWGNLCDFDVRPFLAQTSFVAAGLEFQYPLSFVPRSTNPTDINVRVNGVEVDWDGFNGWLYDSVTNSVVFHGSSIPSPGASIVIEYPYDADCNAN